MKTHDQGAAIFNLHSSNLQHDMLQPQRVNTLNVLARCHFGGLNGTYTYMLLARWSLTLQKQASNLSFVKLKFFLSKILFKRKSLLPKFTHQVLS
jgi:hypothetical protein